MSYLAWWNQLGPRERRYWADIANSSDPEAAFSAYRHAPPVARELGKCARFQDGMEAAESVLRRARGEA